MAVLVCCAASGRRSASTALRAYISWEGPRSGDHQTAPLGEALCATLGHLALAPLHARRRGASSRAASAPRRPRARARAGCRRVARGGSERGRSHHLARPVRPSTCRPSDTSPSFVTRRPSTPVSSSPRGSLVLDRALPCPASPLGSAQTSCLRDGWRLSQRLPRIELTTTPPAENSRLMRWSLYPRRHRQLNAQAIVLACSIRSSTRLSTRRSCRLCRTTRTSSGSPKG